MMMTREIDDMENQNAGQAVVLGQPDNVKKDDYEQPSDDEILREAKRNLIRGRDHRSEWRKEAREDFDFFAGTQWSEEDLQTLEDQGRPAVVFNRIVRTINAVSGVEVQNRQEIKYIPRKVDLNSQPNQPNDSGYSDNMNAASKWVRDQNNSEDEESDAFEDCLICGEGWTETRMDYEIDPQGMIVKDRIDPLSIITDPTSKKRNYEDAKFIAYVKDFSVEEVREMFPNIDITSTGSFWMDSLKEETDQPHDATDAWKYKNDQSSNMTPQGNVSVVLYQCYKVVPAYLVVTEENNTVTLSPKRYEVAKEMLQLAMIKAIPIKVRRYHQYILVANQVASKSVIESGCYTLKAMTGLRDRSRNLRFGLVRLMKDPQRWANKWLSQIQYILNSNAKGGYFVEEGAVKNMRKFEDTVSEPASVTTLNNGGLNKIQPKESPRYPDGIDRLLNYAMGAINEIPGVNLEMLGMANKDQGIDLEVTRKQAGITVLANFFDALRRYRKADGKLLAYYIREYISDGRLIMILGKEGYNYIPLIKSKLAFEYDIIVDDSPTSPSVKDRNFQILMQLIPLALSAGIPIPEEILDYMPISEDLRQKWKEKLQPDPEQQQTEKQIKLLAEMNAKLDLMEKQLGLEKMSSEIAKNYATAEKDKSVGEEQSALAMQKFGVLHNEQNMKSESMQRDQERKDLELILNQNRKMIEVRLDALLRAHKNLNVPSLAQIQ